MLRKTRSNRRLLATKAGILLSLWVAYTPNSLAALVPLSDIPTETIFQYMNGGMNSEFGWWAGYDIGFTQATSTFNIDLRIRLTGYDPGDALRNIWGQGIENIWSGRYQIAQGDEFYYDVAFNADFVESGMHHVVTVFEGTGNGVNMNNWETQNPNGWPQDKQDEIAAHEAGHMFGNFDEHSNGAVNPDGSYPNVYDSIMGSGLTQTVRPRQYQFITDWVSGIEPTQSFSVVENLPSAPGVPLPPSLLLFGSGLFGLVGIAKRKKAS